LATCEIFPSSKGGHGQSGSVVNMPLVGGWSLGAEERRSWANCSHN